MPIPPLNALRTFETVARLGSFKAAADHLCVTQSAVSHQIKNIESWFGEVLFLREGNRTRLVPRGEDLSRRLSLAFAEIETACMQLRDRGPEPLIIAAIPSVAICWLIPRLDRFKARHPETVIRIVYGLHGHDLDFSAVHVAFTFAPAPPDIPGVLVRPFLSGESLPVCRHSLVERLGHLPETIADFRALGLLHDRDLGGWTQWFAQRGLTQGAPLPGPLFEDFNLLRAAVLAGQGVALCPLAMIGPDIAAGHLVALSGTPQPVGADYYLLTAERAGRTTRDRIAAFADWVMEETAQ